MFEVLGLKLEGVRAFYGLGLRFRALRLRVTGFIHGSSGSAAAKSSFFSLGA